MATPTTELDLRFSDPGASPTDWASAERALSDAQLSWITTVRADGRPHVTPLVAVWLDGAVHFCTGADEQKAVNLRSNPEVALTTGTNAWEQGLDVVVEGEATRVTDRATLQRLADAWAAKWDGQWRFEVGDGEFRHEAGGALVFAVHPRTVMAYGKAPFTQTRHRF